jgi:hypothetical protein
MVVMLREWTVIVGEAGDHSDVGIAGEVVRQIDSWCRKVEDEACESSPMSNSKRGE